MIQLYIYMYLGLPLGSVGKESACNAGDAGSIPESGRTPEEEMATQYSCLESSMDRGAWQAIVHGVSESWTQLTTLTGIPRGVRHKE